MSTPEQNQQTDELIAALLCRADNLDRHMGQHEFAGEIRGVVATLTAENARLREALEGNKVDIFDLLGAMNAGEPLPKILVRVNDIYTRADAALTPQEGQSDD